MRYFLVFIISIVFFLASFFSIFYIYQYLDNPRLAHELSSYLTFPKAVAILISCATLYPCLCGIILSGGKMINGIMEIFRKD